MKLVEGSYDELGTNLESEKIPVRDSGKELGGNYEEI